MKALRSTIEESMVIDYIGNYTISNGFSIISNQKNGVHYCNDYL